MNVNILGISELKWTGMGEFNSDDHYIYYCRQESLRRNEVAIMANKRVQNAVSVCVLSHFSCVQLFAILWTVTCLRLSVHRIFQARILEWVAMPSFRGSSQTRDGTHVS